MITLRTATLEDVEEVGVVFRTASLSNDGDREALLAASEFLSWEGTHVERHRTRVAVDDGRIVGFATTLEAGEVLELEDLFVHPDFMRRGIGRRLIDDALAVAETSGHAAIEVTANPHALEFYESVGFVGDSRVATPLSEGLRMRLEVPNH